MTLLAVDLAGPRGPDADPAAVPRYAVTRAGWYSHYGDFEENPLESYGQGEIRASALIVYSSTSYDRLGLGMSSEGGSDHKFQIGLYSDTGVGYPASLLRSGTVDNRAPEVVIPAVTLTRGIWWLAFICTARPNNNFPYVKSLSIGLGWPAIPSGGYGYIGSVSGGLPATFPAGCTPVAGGSRHPRVLIRAT